MLLKKAHIMMYELGDHYCRDKEGYLKDNAVGWDADLYIQIGNVLHKEKMISSYHDKQKLFSVDGNNELVTFKEFYITNTAPDVEPLSESEFDAVRKLKVDEVWNSGLSASVKRIK